MPLPYFSLYNSNGNLEMAPFARTAYDFWFYRGTWGATKQRIVSLLNVAVLFLAVYFFAYMFNWEAAVTCTEETCAKVGDLVHAPTRQLLTTSPWRVWLLAFVFLVASGAAVIWEALRVVRTYVTMCEFEECLGGDGGLALPPRSPLHALASHLVWLRAGGYDEIPGYEGADAQRLEDVAWDSFLAHLCRKLRAGAIPSVPNPETYDELKFVQLLLIEENHRVALSFGGGAHSTVFEKHTSLALLDDNVADLLVRQVLSSNYDLSGTADEIYTRVSHRLIVAVVWSFILWPFVSAHFFIKLIVNNLADVKSHPTSLLQRDFTSLARWKLRLYNEVHHLHSTRLRQGVDLANEMVTRSVTPNEYRRVVHRLGTTIIAAVAIVSLINAPVLTFGVAWGKSPTWWLWLAAIAYAVGSSKDAPLREYHHHGDLRKLYRLLHYQSESWSYSASHFRRAITATLLTSRLWLIVVSFVKILLVPVTLFHLQRNPTALVALIEALREHRHTIDNIGDACGTSAFVPPLSDQPGTGATNRKLVKSIASFGAVYREWRQRQMSIAQIAGLQLRFVRRGERDWEMPPLAHFFDKYRSPRGDGATAADEVELARWMLQTLGAPPSALAVPQLDDWDSGKLGVHIQETSPFRLAIFVHNLFSDFVSAASKDMGASAADASGHLTTLPPTPRGPTTTAAAASLSGGAGAALGEEPAAFFESTAHEREQLMVSKLDDRFADKISSQVRRTAVIAEQRIEVAAETRQAPSSSRSVVAPIVLQPGSPGGYGGVGARRSPTPPPASSTGVGGSGSGSLPSSIEMRPIN